MVDKNKNSSLILEGSLFKALLVLAVPIILNNLIQTLYSLGDAFWVSRIGDTEVAAVNFVWPVSFLTISFAMGLSIAGAAIISQYIGAKKYQDANETAQQLYTFAILFGIFSSIIGILLSPHIIRWMGATGNLYTTSTVYLKILFLEMPLLFIMNIYFSINQAQGDTLNPTILNVSSAILNVILDPIFIFSFHLGIQGAALATVLARVPFTIYAVYRFSKGCNLIKIPSFQLKFNKSKMVDLIRIGIPSSLGNCGVALGFIILHVFVVKYGEYAVVALGIGNRINSLAFMPAVGIGAALSTITAQNLGANKVHRIKKAFTNSLVLSLCFQIVGCVFLWIFSRDLIMIFSKTEDVVRMGDFYLKTLAATTWSFAFFNCTIGLLNGSGHTIHSMILEAGRLWLIRIPLIIILGAYTTMGANSIWYGVSISNVIAAIAAIFFAMSGVWKKPKIKDVSVM